MYPVYWTFSFFGLALIVAIMEIFLPSGGLLSVLAISLLVASVVFAFQVDFVFGSLYTFCVCLFVPIFLWIALNMWPNTWIGRQILLAPEDDPALCPDEEQDLLKQLIGKHGMAKSKMLLVGLVEIEGNQYNAVSDAEAIEAGEPVGVIRIEGSSIIVRKLHKVEIQSASSEEVPMEDPFA
ncbi:MAG: hypothetical protein FWG73_00810 [Planctomycetaceae bacterium]|nr:hypothetical protein [Planctomycetaceae bacterium]